MNSVIREIAKDQIKKDIPSFVVGDTVTVTVRIIEGDKERQQKFKGIVIAKKGSEGINASFTVRHVTGGYGVERVFLTNSPKIASIKVMKKGLVRRAKLYYLRGRVGKKATKVKERA